MKNQVTDNIRLLLAIGFILGWITTACAAKFEGTDYCDDKMVGGSVCKIKTKDLRPSQFGIGLNEVKCRMDRIESMSKSDLEDYLKEEKNWVSVVIGPHGIYLTDGHHGSRAVHEADIDDDEKVMYAKVIDNWAKYTSDEFWMKLVDEGYLWLVDEKGFGPIAPEWFPKDLSNMANDPYRSLAWMTKHEGAWAKVGKPFEDFLWANFFRKHVPFNSSVPLAGGPFETNYSSWTWCSVRPYSPACLPDETQALQDVLPMALKMAASPLAADLPGYGEGIVDVPKCG
eukprot:TRINITY_DN9008_c0_g1_i1.p1 TRINITY_DN9008_c0_g1~~TRINITY_DN9008_c0_g1_i1.p1  ORF type:complete len:285 (+),score=26.27 TRINITY_DN9008_c0_g1_i1:27-881(+)